MGTPLTGVQFRIVLWVVRRTLGWNRQWTSFTWYQLAKEFELDRASTYRAGLALLHAHILVEHHKCLAIQTDVHAWAMSVVPRQRNPLPANNDNVVPEQRMRCLATTVFRRAKDRCKDKEKTYRKTARQTYAEDAPRQTNAVPGKYDGISQI